MSAFGELGVWLSRTLPAGEVTEVAEAAERLGYGAFWLSGGASRGVFDEAGRVLEATRRIPVGTSIANMYAETPAEAGDAFWALESRFPGRFFLGAGPSHAPLVAKNGLGSYDKPLAKSRSYLHGLDAQPAPVPRERRLISALGPLALALAAERTLGSIPYLVPVAHTVSAREILGRGPVLAPELGVVLCDDDIAAGRARAREFLAHYLQFPNYTGTFLRHGLTGADLEDGGSDRLIDSVFALGSVADIGARIDEHLAAGADHVAVQVLPLEGQRRVDILSAIADARLSRTAR